MQVPIVRSTRGAAGGYHLIRPPEDVSLGQVMDVIKGTSASANGKTPSASPDSPAVKVLMKAWKQVDAKEREMLNEITFAELLDRAKQEEGQMYYI